MQVHRLIEYLKTATELDRECSRLIERAQKFAFNPGPVPQEILEGANQYTRQLMAAEIFPMPFDACLFEFGPRGLVAVDSAISEDDNWLWVLAWREKDERVTGGWKILFRAFTCFKRAGGMQPIAGVGQIFIDEFEDTGSLGYFHVVGRDKQHMESFERGVSLVKHDPIERRKMIEDVCRNIPGISLAEAEEMLAEFTDDSTKFQDCLSNFLDIAFGQLLNVLGLMSTSAGVSVDLIQPKRKFINSLRVKKGKALLEFEHRIVSIDPALTRMPGMIAAGGSHASPRLHWRRGHIRTLQDGRKVQVKPCIVGDVTRGTITHEYVLRPLAH